MASGYRNFTDRGLTVALEAYIFPGLTGAHKIELIYADYSGPGILSFSPKDVNLAKASTSRSFLAFSSCDFVARGGLAAGEFRNVAPARPRRRGPSTRCSGRGFSMGGPCATLARLSPPLPCCHGPSLLCPSPPSRSTS